AEERGQVGGQGVDEVLLLAVLVALDAVEVVAEALQAARAQAPRQAAVDHVALVRAEADPGAGVDHPAHALEVALLEREGARAGSASGDAQRAASQWSNTGRGSAVEYRNPWTSWQPNSRSRATWSSDSTPSAITSMSKFFAIRVIERTIALSPRLATRSRTNERSILTRSTGSRCSNENETWPVTKSS